MAWIRPDYPEQYLYSIKVANLAIPRSVAQPLLDNMPN